MGIISETFTAGKSDIGKVVVALVDGCAVTCGDEKFFLVNVGEKGEEKFKVCDRKFGDICYLTDISFTDFLGKMLNKEVTILYEERHGGIV